MPRPPELLRVTEGPPRPRVLLRMMEGPPRYSSVLLLKPPRPWVRWPLRMGDEQKYWRRSNRHSHDNGDGLHGGKMWRNGSRDGVGPWPLWSLYELPLCCCLGSWHSIPWKRVRFGPLCRRQSNFLFLALVTPAQHEPRALAPATGFSSTASTSSNRIRASIAMV